MKDKAAFKRNRTSPSRHALCVRLTAHDHLAGLFLFSILHWAKYGRAEIPHVEGEWVANPRSWWRRECCLSSSQYDRSIAKLKKLDLIETRQWWWGHKNILHLRPTKKSLDYIASARTWIAADQFFPDQHLVKNQDPGSVAVVISNGNDAFDKLGSTELLISNNISNSPNNQTVNPTCAVPATPVCAGGVDLKEPPSGNSEIKEAKAIIDLKKLEHVWLNHPSQLHDGNGSGKGGVAQLDASDRGALALVENFISGVTSQQFSVPDEDYQALVEEFLVYVLGYWSSVGAYKQPSHPSLVFLAENFDPFVQAWLDSEAWLDSVSGTEEDAH